MRIEQLAYLLEIAKKSSFSSASENLHLTPQSLSRSISCMENELGFKLFVRSPQGVRFTQGGEIFLETAKKIVEQYQAALTAIGESLQVGEKKELSGELVIYANPLFLIYWLPNRLQKFCAAHSTVRVTVLEKDPQGIYTRLQQAEKDNDAISRIGLVSMPYPKKNFFADMGKYNTIQFKALKKEPYYLYAHRTSVLAREETATIRQVLKEPIVLFSSDEANMTPVRYLLEQYGKPNVVFMASSLHLWLTAINNGTGVGLIQESLLDLDGQIPQGFPDIVKIDLKEEICALLGYLYWGEPTDIIKAFVQYF